MLEPGWDLPFVLTKPVKETINSGKQAERGDLLHEATLGRGTNTEAQ